MKITHITTTSSPNTPAIVTSMFNGTGDGPVHSDSRRYQTGPQGPPQGAPEAETLEGHGCGGFTSKRVPRASREERGGDALLSAYGSSSCSVPRPRLPGRRRLGFLRWEAAPPIPTTLQHAAYRNNKLTMLMSDALGGNCKTVMLCCLVPTPSHMEELLTALIYAYHLKCVTNTPTPYDIPADLQRLEEQIRSIDFGK